MAEAFKKTTKWLECAMLHNAGDGSASHDSVCAWPSTYISGAPAKMTIPASEGKMQPAAIPLRRSKAPRSGQRSAQLSSATAHGKRSKC